MRKLKVLFRLLWIFVVMFIIFAGFFLYQVYKDFVDVEGIYPGISVGGEAVEGLTAAQAENKMEMLLYSRISNVTLTLLADDVKMFVKPEDIGFTYNVKLPIEKAYAVGRSGNLWQRVQEIRSASKGMDFPLEFTYQEEKMDDIIRNLERLINRDFEEGTFEFIDGEIRSTSGKTGRKVDALSLRKELEQYVSELPMLAVPKDVKVAVQIVKPSNMSDYGRINGIIGQFTTSLQKSSETRNKNVEISTKAMDGLLVFPGQTVSYNEKTGLRNTKNGYQNAYVIINGQYEQGVGGGVCQTSTTLYNALLRAGVTVTERHNHSIPASYVPYGLDAAVNDTNMDLKFRNDFDYPIFIHGKMNSQEVTFVIYGDTKGKKYEFKFDSKVLSTTKHKVQEVYDGKLGKKARKLQREGRDGMKVESYKHVYDKAGKLIETKVLNQDSYPAIDAIYKVGKKAKKTSKLMFMPKRLYANSFETYFA